MLQNDTVAIRNAAGEALLEIGTKDERIVALTGDLTKPTRMNLFAAKFPERFFNFGIAEQNMICAASGLATCGKIPFVSTFAIFGAGKVWEMTRQMITYNKVNVKILVTHGGVCAAREGTTHQCTEDFALMRSLANLVVIVPADAYEAREAVKAAAEWDGPVYIRIGRAVQPNVSGDRPKLRIGKGLVKRKGKDITIVATGLMVSLAIEAAEALAANDVDAEVIDIHTLKPLDKELVRASASETRAVLTVEEHSIIGGLGEAVAPHVVDCCDCFERIGLPDVYSEGGEPEKVMELFGLTSSNIVAKAIQLLERKK